MCGLAGFMEGKSATTESLTHVVQRMAGTLAHRGPDDGGHWVDCEAGVALGHRRLAIVDLSAAAHQPMHSACGRYVIAFNGEIYNFRKLRDELAARGAAANWRGHSDTEVLLAALVEFGVEGALGRCVGMFAFALWDRKERTLTLARDRLGEKPLYYGWQDGVFLFSSELKAMRAHTAFRAEIDRDALALFLRYSYVPTPYSIYKGICKLPPGTYIRIGHNSIGARRTSTGEAPIPYWSARDMATTALAERFAGNAHDAVDELDKLLRQSVTGQSMADVPLGAFLSGGVDSSTVVAIMQALSSRPVKTFSAGFHEAGYDEAGYAKAVARHLGTEHTELYVTPRQSLDVIPRLPAIWDEPFSDVSQIPMLLIAELTRRHVNVSLSGDGGDELFGGYNRYFELRRIWSKIHHIPLAMRRTAASAITSFSPAALARAVTPLLRLAPARTRYSNAGEKLHKLAEAIASATPEAVYRDAFVSHWKDPAAVVVGATEPETLVTAKSKWPDMRDYTERMMWLDLVTYLPDDVLVKVDRAAMAASLETRAPFLDHRVVEFAWRLPLSMKIKHGQGKWILRKVLYRYVPKELIERPKMGFGVPIHGWLRGPLRDWAAALLDPARLASEGFFRPEPITRKWQEHLSGRRNWQHPLWGILMFQAWFDQQKQDQARSTRYPLKSVHP